MPTITGNVGGTAGSGARVQLQNKNGSVSLLANADSSGDFTFTVSDNDTYLLQAFLVGFVIRQKYEVKIKGASIAAVNFTLSAINSSNI
jgi:hypothetical protein